MANIRIIQPNSPGAYQEEIKEIPKIYFELIPADQKVWDVLEGQELPLVFEQMISKALAWRLANERNCAVFDLDNGRFALCPFDHPGFRQNLSAGRIPLIPQSQLQPQLESGLDASEVTAMQHFENMDPGTNSSELESGMPQVKKKLGFMRRLLPSAAQMIPGMRYIRRKMDKLEETGFYKYNEGVVIPGQNSGTWGYGKIEGYNDPDTGFPILLDLSDEAYALNPRVFLLRQIVLIKANMPASNKAVELLCSWLNISRKTLFKIIRDGGSSDTPNNIIRLEDVIRIIDSMSGDVIDQIQVLKSDFDKNVNFSDRVSTEMAIEAAAGGVITGVWGYAMGGALVGASGAAAIKAMDISRSTLEMAFTAQKEIRKIDFSKQPEITALILATLVPKVIASGTAGDPITRFFVNGAFSLTISAVVTKRYEILAENEIRDAGRELTEGEQARILNKYKKQGQALIRFYSNAAGVAAAANNPLFQGIALRLGAGANEIMGAHEHLEVAQEEVQRLINPDGSNVGAQATNFPNGLNGSSPESLDEEWQLVRGNNFSLLEEQQRVNAGANVVNGNLLNGGGFGAENERLIHVQGNNARINDPLNEFNERLRGGQPEAQRGVFHNGINPGQPAALQALEPNQALIPNNQQAALAAQQIPGQPQLVQGLNLNGLLAQAQQGQGVPVPPPQIAPPLDIINFARNAVDNFIANLPPDVRQLMDDVGNAIGNGARQLLIDLLLTTNTAIVSVDFHLNNLLNGLQMIFNNAGVPIPAVSGGVGSIPSGELTLGILRDGLQADGGDSPVRQLEELFRTSPGDPRVFQFQETAAAYMRSLPPGSPILTSIINRFNGHDDPNGIPMFSDIEINKMMNPATTVGEISTMFNGRPNGAANFVGIVSAEYHESLAPSDPDFWASRMDRMPGVEFKLPDVLGLSSPPIVLHAAASPVHGLHIAERLGPPGRLAFGLMGALAGARLLGIGRNIRRRNIAARQAANPNQPRNIFQRIFGNRGAQAQNNIRNLPDDQAIIDEINELMRLVENPRNSRMSRELYRRVLALNNRLGNPQGFMQPFDNIRRGRRLRRGMGNYQDGRARRAAARQALDEQRALIQARINAAAAAQPNPAGGAANPNPQPQDGGVGQGGGPAAGGATTAVNPGAAATQTIDPTRGQTINIYNGQTPIRQMPIRRRRRAETLSQPDRNPNEMNEAVLAHNSQVMQQFLEEYRQQRADLLASIERERADFRADQGAARTQQAEQHRANLEQQRALLESLNERIAQTEANNQRLLDEAADREKQRREAETQRRQEDRQDRETAFAREDQIRQEFRDELAQRFEAITQQLGTNQRQPDEDIQTIINNLQQTLNDRLDKLEGLIADNTPDGLEASASLASSVLAEIQSILNRLGSGGDETQAKADLEKLKEDTDRLFKLLIENLAIQNQLETKQKKSNPEGQLTNNELVELHLARLNIEFIRLYYKLNDKNKRKLLELIKILMENENSLLSKFSGYKYSDFTTELKRELDTFRSNRQQTVQNTTPTLQNLIFMLRNTKLYKIIQAILIGANLSIDGDDDKKLLNAIYSRILTSITLLAYYRGSFAFSDTEEMELTRQLIALNKDQE